MGEREGQSKISHRFRKQRAHLGQSPAEQQYEEFARKNRAWDEKVRSSLKRLHQAKGAHGSAG